MTPEELIAAGWQWSASEANVLVDREDASQTVYVDPYTHEVLLSPAVVQALRARFGKQ